MSMDNFEYRKAVERKAGYYKCIVLSAVRGISKEKGNPMITVKFRPSGTASTLTKYFVDNEYFDSNISRFMDAFPEIDRSEGVTFPEHWRGAIGFVNLVVDEDGYFKLADKRTFLSAKSDLAESLEDEMPDFIWKARSDEDPEMPVFGNFGPLEDEAPLPF